ncbi:Threonylcarbamoyl-AMP synthase [Candidatus Syntrophocurvum alkaliphilum]|uniref:Threonylcarbamoyl-AMP synthase n=1 Tax=Candidatus Syntrophocurvum alkaliphilum TaxID=2293317 RepID=A0A6I6DPD1_9FIRM|nr:Threonylcarbamoyl-AMP synthase [Candidatus Syntrophocurvum alkaliphilum]
MGGHCLNKEAAKKVFAAKMRPLDSPLLVHVSTIEQVNELVNTIPEAAKKLMNEFWPGPLSIILPSKETVPPEVTGGKKTVGLRMPAHPVAIALINKTGPLAATSANLSGRPSPVTAEHVKNDLEGRIPIILDAGPTGVGVESTIVDLSTSETTILRHGGIDEEKIRECLEAEYINVETQDSSYQTLIKIILAKNMNDFYKLIENNIRNKKKIGVVHNNIINTNSIKNVYNNYLINLEKNTGELFSLLRDAETKKVEVLIFAPLPEDKFGLSSALIERIRKATSKE